jgi:hypothetical protein
VVRDLVRQLGVVPIATDLRQKQHAEVNEEAVAGDRVVRLFESEEDWFTDLHSAHRRNCLRGPEVHLVDATVLGVRSEEIEPGLVRVRDEPSTGVIRTHGGTPRSPPPGGPGRDATSSATE